MKFSLPVELDYGNRRYMAAMTFEHSMQREFALTVSKKALQECNDKEKLREVALNLLEGWAMMNTAVQGLMKENIELRQAMALRDSSLEAADALLTEAGEALKKYERQSSRAKWRLWPFGQ
jgi:hypothetical protein